MFSVFFVPFETLQKSKTNNFLSIYQIKNLEYELQFKIGRFKRWWFWVNVWVSINFLPCFVENIWVLKWLKRQIQGANKYISDFDGDFFCQIDQNTVNKAFVVHSNLIYEFLTKFCIFLIKNKWITYLIRQRDNI